jgi:hypothetical protein
MAVFGLSWDSEGRMRAWAMLAVLVGCGTGGSGEQATFYDDVVPVLDQHCTRCHQDDAIAPMTFGTYEDARQWGPAMVAAVEARTMPPKARTITDGSCGTFADGGWLTDEEVAAFVDWAASDYPEGTPVARTLPPKRELTGDVVTVRTPEFAPEPVGSAQARFDEYRCFPITLDNTEDVFVTGYDVVPGNPAIVHHLIGNLVMPDASSWDPRRTNRQVMEDLDAQSPDRLGWPCFSEAGPEVRIEADPVAWAPGEPVLTFPEGTGVRVPAGAILVAQVHYNLVDAETAGQSDQTEVHLQVADSVERELFPLYLDYLLGTGASIPPGRSSFKYEDGARIEWIVGDYALDLYGVLPHMHERGKKLVARRISDTGDKECMVQVANWDFNWESPHRV